MSFDRPGWLGATPHVHQQPKDMLPVQIHSTQRRRLALLHPVTIELTPPKRTEPHSAALTARPKMRVTCRVAAAHHVLNCTFDPSAGLLNRPNRPTDRPTGQSNNAQNKTKNTRQKACKSPIFSQVSQPLEQRQHSTSKWSNNKQMKRAATNKRVSKKKASGQPKKSTQAGCDEPARWNSTSLAVKLLNHSDIVSCCMQASPDDATQVSNATSERFLCCTCTLFCLSALGHALQLVKKHTMTRVECRHVICCWCWLLCFACCWCCSC